MTFRVFSACCGVMGVALTTALSFEPVASQVSPSCVSDCVVDLQRVVTVGDGGQPGTLPEQAINVIRNSNGRYLVAARDLKKILAVDGSGKIAKIIEGTTARPFSLIANLLPGPNGATLAFDSVNRSLTTIGADLSVQKVTPFSNRPNISLPNNQFVFVGQVGRPETVGYRDCRAVIRTERTRSGIRTSTPHSAGPADVD